MTAARIARFIGALAVTGALGGVAVQWAWDKLNEAWHDDLNAGCQL